MPPYNTIDDVVAETHIDSRDLIELRDTLTLERDDEQDADARAVLADAIEAIDELEDAGLEDWQYGAYMIREDCFEDYARELSEDIGAITGFETWPANCIDWKRAARELAMDYSTVELLGYDYYVR